MLDIVQNFTQKVQIMIRINVIDKRTGKIAYISEEQYDHCAIVTSMKDKGGHVKKSIIIDPYFNKTMTCNEAQDEYLALIPIWTINEVIEKTEKSIIEAEMKDCGILGKKLPIDFDIENYEFEPKVVLRKAKDSIHDIKDHNEAKEFGELVREEFLNYCLKNFRVVIKL